MFHIFRNVSHPPLQTQTRKRFGFLRECGLFFSHLTHGCKNVCRLQKKREQDRGKEQMHGIEKQREGKQGRMAEAKTHEWKYRRSKLFLFSAEFPVIIVNHKSLSTIKQSKLEAISKRNNRRKEGKVFSCFFLNSNCTATPGK